MKRFLIKFVVGAIILTSFSSSIYAGSFTEENQATIDTLTEELRYAPIDRCKDFLFTIYDLEIAKFFDQLDTTFKNKSSTSSLINILIIRFTDYKDALNGHFANLNFAYSSSNITGSVTTNYIECSGITEEYIALGKSHMIDQVKINAMQKKSAIMLEKFQALNEKMTEMNDSTVEFYSFFQTFNNKLFGFIKKCV